MPFAFPKSDGDLHNAINFLSVPLPVSSKFSSPELRLKQVNRTMNSLKYSPAPLVTMKLQKFVAGPLFPASLRKAVTMKMFSKHTMVKGGYQTKKSSTTNQPILGFF